MAVHRLSILSVPEWMGVNNYFTVVQVCMFEKCIATEDSEEEYKENISRYLLKSNLQPSDN